MSAISTLTGTRGANRYARRSGAWAVGHRAGVAAALLVTMVVAGAAQTRSGGGAPGGGVGQPSPRAVSLTAVPDDPFTGPVVTNAPFSADAVTTVTQVLSDGTRIEQTTTARFYRDSAGRVRREQMILGLDALNPTGEARPAITVDPDPGDAFAYTLDPVAKTARQVSRSLGTAATWSSGANAPTALRLAASEVLYSVLDSNNELARRVRARPVNGAVAQPEESLGTHQVEGVAATGRRARSVIPTGQIGNDRPIEIVDERWESSELRLLVRSHHRDPRTGEVEYRLTNISRSEPAADLFTIPADYMVVPAGGGGARGRGTAAPAAPAVVTPGARSGRRSGGPQ